MMFKKTARRMSLSNVEALNVGPIQASVLSLVVKIKEASGESPNATLLVEIKNLGKVQLQGITISATAPGGVGIVDTDELFGKTFRNFRIPSIAPSQLIRFRLGIKMNEEFRHGNMLFLIHETGGLASLENACIRTTLALRAQHKQEDYRRDRE